MTSAATPPPAPWAPPAVQPRGSSPGRLLLFFVVALLVVVGIGAVISLALSPPARQGNCPDPTVPCERPPEDPTLGPDADGGAASTPRATIFRPGSALPTLAPGAVFPVPSPRAPSTAARLAAGTLWSSDGLGYAFEYDDGLWTVRDSGENGVFLTGANGNVGLTIVGYAAGEVSPRDALQREVDRLNDVIIGFTEEPDAENQLPGTPVIGYETGVGNVYAGTLNTPQGPGPNVSIALLAASDGQVTILVNVTTVDALREPAFAAVDSVLNTVRWPGRPE